MQIPASEHLGLTETGGRVHSVHRLVDFSDPPIVETVLGVFFVPLSGFGILHQGAYWSRVRARYPRYEVMPAIGESEIRFGPQGMQLTIPRALLIEHSGAQLVQLQSNGFFRNWRKVPETPGYIHYDVMRPSFGRDWDEFLGFLTQEGISEPEILEAQVTYINQFVRGSDWDSAEDLAALLKMRDLIPQNELIAGVSRFSFHKTFELKGNAGRLEVFAQPGIRQVDGKEIMQLTLTAAGKPHVTATSNLMGWFDLGHAAVVTTFDEMTSDEAHKRWGKK